jgi:predicted aspartyl protease
MNVYSYTYDEVHDPPAPVAEISVYPPRTPAREARLTVLIDTGADVSTLPLRVLKRIGAEYLETATLLGVAGGRITVDPYRIAVRVGPHTAPTLRVAGVASTTDAVLGRDVLNHLKVTLDGPAHTIEIES